MEPAKRHHDDAPEQSGDVTPSGPLSTAELGRRVKRGVFFVGSWGVVNLIVGFFGSLVLARMLTPSDFGLVALGTTMIVLGTSLGDGGLGSGLIRRPEAPSRGELRTVLGLQLTVTTAIAAVAAAVAAAFGTSGLVVAVMMVGLPLAALQTPGRIVLSRELRFRELTGIDAAGMFAYYAWALAWVFAGWGVWALATATVVKALVSSGGLVAVTRLGMLRPSYAGTRALRPVIAFGVRFQAVSLAGMGREQGLNAGVAALAGVATLGIWSLAKRLLEFPVLLFEPLHRVSFPYMSQMLAANERLARLLDRGVAISATASGALLAAFAAAAPGLVPGLFGDQWSSSAEIVQWICGSFMVSGPIAVVAVGYLYATGAPSVVLRATILHTLTLFAVTFALLPFWGAAAIGAGSLAGAVVDSIIMGRAISRRAGARPFRNLATPLGAAVVAAAAGSAVTWEAGQSLLAGLAGGTAAAALYVALLAAVRQQALRETADMILATLRSGVTPESPPVPAERAA